MKIRSDFITNSSSSSFILAFSNKENGLSEIAKMTERYGSVYIGQLLKDFIEAKPILPKEVVKHVDDDFRSEARHKVLYGEGGWYNSRKDTFEKRWMEAHPGATYSDFINSEEYAAEIDRLKNEKAKELLEKLGDKQYIVELEYEDHTDVGSELEHYILPNCDFTVRSFNHH